MMRIAVIGAGLIGRRHVDIIQRCDRATLSSIVDPNPDVQTTARELGIDWFASLENMLATDQPDGVIIATPNQMHVQNGLACVDAKIPMLIEKPIADEAHSAKGLVDRAKAEGVAILVGHHRRHNALIHNAKQQIESGALGKIVAAHASCWLYKPDDYFNVTWRTKEGAGPVYINLIHDIDLLRYLIGDVESVQATQSRKTRGFEVEDTAAVILKFSNGALATVTVSDTIVAPWSWELTAAENPAYPATGQNCYSIGGTRGSLEIPTGKFWHQENEPSWWKPIHNTEAQSFDGDPLNAQFDHFCDVVAGASAPLVSGEEGLNSLRVIEAIKQAAQTGQTVSVENT